ncbi:MAG: Cu(I)-responsive transcriptional regulator [Hyphomicrobiales bacterium]|nr:Cu(I)-responsive transcriptional regulator [Hyphomicrobiales bacterium]
MSIGQASKSAGVSAKMIRYYESIGLIAPPRRSAAGYRFYDEADIRTLRFVRRARDLGFPVEDIGRLLALWRDKDRASADVKKLARQRIAELDARIAALASMRRALERLTAHCHGDDLPDCPILDELAVDETPPGPLKIGA